MILAAGAALPSVFTLSSGAQTAQASNLVCLLKQGSPPARFTTDGDYARWPDGWLRAPVNFGEYDGTPADCVTSPQEQCAEFSLNTSRGASTLNAADGSVWMVRGERMVSNPNVRITNIRLGRKHYGLVYVDQSGTVATLDPNGAPNLSPTTVSCWASIMGGRISKLG